MNNMYAPIYNNTYIPGSSINTQIYIYTYVYMYIHVGTQYIYIYTYKYIYMHTYCYCCCFCYSMQQRIYNLQHDIMNASAALDMKTNMFFTKWSLYSNPCPSLSFSVSECIYIYIYTYVGRYETLYIRIIYLYNYIRRHLSELQRVSLHLQFLGILQTPISHYCNPLQPPSCSLQSTYTAECTLPDCIIIQTKGHRESAIRCHRAPQAASNRPPPPSPSSLDTPEINENS